MKYCCHCGKEIMDEAVVCPGCGCSTNGAKNINTATSGEDIPNYGLNVLAFLIPLAGLIMFCVMHGKTPRKANQIGIFAIVGFVINLILIALMPI